MLLCICSVIDHRVIDHISYTLGYAWCATFLFLPHFDVICDLLLNRCTATWNLFVKLRLMVSESAGLRRYSRKS